MPICLSPLKNNSIGQVNFKSTAWTEKPKWYTPGKVKAPSDETMANAIFAKTKIAMDERKIHQKVKIIYTQRILHP